MAAFLVLTSPSAGSTDAGTTEPALAVLRVAGPVEVVASGSPEELDTALDGRGERTLVVAGGDGSLHAVLNRLHRRGELDQDPLGLLPLGTGNDFARGLGLPTGAAGPQQAAELTTLVAKVEAVGPAAFVTDLGLLENRFQFQRYLQTAAD